MADNDYALVVGVDHYPAYGENLDGAITDAEAVRDWLLDKKGGDVDPANLRYIPSEARPPAPIQDQIDDALQELLIAAKPNKSKKDARRMYFYFSGHGMAVSSEELALCLAKWSKDRRGAALDSLAYRTMLRDAGRFKEVVVWLDCCRVREVGLRAQEPEVGAAVPAERGADLFVGYATTFQDAAFEAATGEDKVVRGHFTRALIAGLKGGAQVNGRVTGASLKEYLDREIPVIAKAASHEQQPEVNAGRLAQVVLCSPDRVTLVKFDLSGHTGRIVLEGPDLEVIWEGDASEGPFELELAPSKMYLLSHPESGDELAVRVRPGKEVPYVRF